MPNVGERIITTSTLLGLNEHDCPIGSIGTIINLRAGGNIDVEFVGNRRHIWVVEPGKWVPYSNDEKKLFKISLYRSDSLGEHQVSFDYVTLGMVRDLERASVSTLFENNEDDNLMYSLEGLREGRGVPVTDLAFRAWGVILVEELHV